MRNVNEAECSDASHCQVRFRTNSTKVQCQCSLIYHSAPVMIWLLRASVNDTGADVLRTMLVYGLLACFKTSDGLLDVGRQALKLACLIYKLETVYASNATTSSTPWGSAHNLTTI